MGIILCNKMELTMNFNPHNDFTLIKNMLINVDYTALVHPNDRTIFDKLQLHKFNAVIAGGAALSWFQHQPIGNKDIDVWFKTKRDFLNMSEHLIKLEFRKQFDSEYAETFRAASTGVIEDYRIQLIKQPYIDSPNELFKQFDISVCQIATDNNSWWFGEYFLEDLKNKKLRLINLKPNSLKRVLKYWSYGFQPDDEIINNIMNNPDTIWDFTTNIDEEYANAI